MNGLKKVTATVEIHVPILKRKISKASNGFSLVRKNERHRVVMPEEAEKRREEAGDIVGVENAINTRLIYEIFRSVRRAREFNNTALHSLVNDADGTITYAGQCQNKWLRPRLMGPVDTGFD
jgi:hypothetical protein